MPSIPSRPSSLPNSSTFLTSNAFRAIGLITVISTNNTTIAKIKVWNNLGSSSLIQSDSSYPNVSSSEENFIFMTSILSLLSSSNPTATFTKFEILSKSSCVLGIYSDSPVSWLIL